MNIAELITRAEALRTDIQAAVAAGKATAQLVNAASFAAATVDHLENHVIAAKLAEDNAAAAIAAPAAEPLASAALS